MSVGDGHLIDPDRLRHLEPGTILREHDTGTRVLIVWNGFSVIQQRPGRTAVIYADADTTLTIESQPTAVERPALTVELADRIRGVLELPAGAIFTEVDDIGRTHRFIRTFTGVILDNGLHHDTHYDGGYDGTALQLSSLSELVGERV